MKLFETYIIDIIDNTSKLNTPNKFNTLYLSNGPLTIHGTWECASARARTPVKRAIPSVNLDCHNQK